MQLVKLSIYFVCALYGNASEHSLEMPKWIIFNSNEAN